MLNSIFGLAGPLAIDLTWSLRSAKSNQSQPTRTPQSARVSAMQMPLVTLIQQLSGAICPQQACSDFHKRQMPPPQCDAADPRTLFVRRRSWTFGPIITAVPVQREVCLCRGIVAPGETNSALYKKNDLTTFGPPTSTRAAKSRGRIAASLITPDWQDQAVLIRPLRPVISLF